MSKRYVSPEEHALRSASQRAAMNRPEVVAKVADGARASWANPAIRQRRIEGQRRALLRRAPNPGHEARLCWISETLAAGDTVNRKILMKQFGVCRTVAWNDIRRFKARFPEAMTYDGKAKAFRAAI